MKAKKNYFNLLYYLIPFVLTFLQAFFTFNSLKQIRYEELAESVRNVYWLSQRSIYDGVSSNVGWYGTLLLLYNLFGFQLFLAKFFRLFLHFISLLCLSLILKKYLGYKKAIVPLLTIGLSPTLLYFNILQTSFGLDLQYLPICIYLLLTEYKNKWFNLLRWAGFGLITMMAWMSYPTFFFYLPALIVIFFSKIKSRLKNILIVGFAFLLPLISTLLWMKNPSTLLYDPITKRGLFRGSGRIQFDDQLFAAGIQGSLRDLFEKDTSYYFEQPNVEFSHILPLLSVIIILCVSLYLAYKFKKFRFFIFLIFFVILFNLILANFTFDSSYMPGIRRNTPVLAGFYLLFILVWHFTTSIKWKEKVVKYVLMGSCLLLTFHHVLVYIPNLQAVSQPSAFKETQWFGIDKDPQTSLNKIITAATYQDLRLTCLDQSREPIPCRYSEVYAAAAADCLWNRKQCNKILGFDLKTNQFIPLTIDLWENYYFAH